MNRSRPRRTTAAGAVLSTLLVLAGCGSTDRAAASAAPSGSPSSTLPSPTPQGKQPVVATPKPKHFPKVVVEVNAVERDANGLLVVVFTLTNHGTGDFGVQNGAFAGSGTNPYTFGGQAGITIVDHAAKQRYYPVTDDATPNNCLCMHGTNNDHSGNVPVGGSQTFWDVYGPDPMPSTIEIDVPGWAPVKNVPVSG